MKTLDRIKIKKLTKLKKGGYTILYLNFDYVMCFIVLCFISRLA